MIKTTRGCVYGDNGHSIEEIQKNISTWIDYSEKTQNTIKQGINTADQSRYLRKVSYSFLSVLHLSVQYIDKIIGNLKKIQSSIKKNEITKRDVVLLDEVGKIASDFNDNYRISYKEESTWKDSNNPDFFVIEDIYAAGRDYFISLEKASSDSVNLMDHIS